MRKWILLDICIIVLFNVEKIYDFKNNDQAKKLITNSQTFYFCLHKEISLTNVELNLHPIDSRMDQEHLRVYVKETGSSLQDFSLNIIKKYCKICKFLFWIEISSI